MGTRERILARITSALGEGRAAPQIPRRGAIDPVLARVGVDGGSDADLTAEFVAALRALSGDAEVISDVSRLPQAIVSIAKKHECGLYVMAESPQLAGLGIKEHLEKAGLGEHRDDGGNESRAAIDMGITGADCAISHSGSLLLVHSEQNPRWVSLVPPVHVAVLREKDILGSLSEAMMVANNALTTDSYGSNLRSHSTIITGPSRTADIELNLTLGVHGPRHVYCLIV